jgi:hypothetical protein
MSHFGNERANYGDSLQNYYKKGPWIGKSHLLVSMLSHPWEDWAETWAHYLHIMDMLETAYFLVWMSNPLRVTPWKLTLLSILILVDFDVIIETIPLSFAVNSINRAIVPDVYPFIVTKDMIKKWNSFIITINKTDLKEERI